MAKEIALVVRGLAPYVGNSAKMAMRVEIPTAARMSVRPVIVDRSAALGHAHGASHRVQTPVSARLVDLGVTLALAQAFCACLGFAPVAGNSA